ncbi:uncharacterized protein BDV17DRAFT_293229 [Aspergillus undulatus]|uniref:uncharacterized protein n=1 Tax=Aspergillus undulatus TaxID=1810928 RepID=UPI003CCDC61A
MKTYDLDVPLAQDPTIAVTALGSLATLSTILRFVSLRMRGVKPGAAEYLILAALIIVYIFIAIQWILSVAGGAGRHVTEVDPASVVVTLKTILPLEALYGIVMSLVKTSIMVFYLNIFGTKRSFRVSVAITMTIVWLWAISVVLETLLLCRPLAFNWDTTIPGGGCGNRNATYVVAGTLNLVTDLMVMALPIPHIWKLQLGVAKKIALSLVFCMGLFVSIISIVRLVALMAIDFNDITHSVQMGVLWTVTEPELAILCANMPVLKPVLSRMFPKLFSTHQRTYNLSDPQAFERLGGSGGYSLNRVGRNPLESTNIYVGDDHLQSKYTTATTRSMDQESRESDQQRLRDHEQDMPGIAVTQNFDIRYGNR